jgi:phage terminase small subunit
MATKQLNDKQLEFCKHYALTNNAVKSYLLAYPNVEYTTAGVNGAKLLKNARIQEEIAKQKELSARQFNITKEELIADLIEIKESQKSKNSHASLKAIEQLSKMLGMNEPEKVEHSGNQIVTVIKLTEVIKDNGTTDKA